MQITAPKKRLQAASTRTQAPQYEAVRVSESDTWESSTLIRDRDEIFVQQNFHPRAVHRDEEIVEAFGTSTPHSGDALLHYAGAPSDTGESKTPALLIHGANKNGHFFWDPSEDGSNKGLAQRLRDEGHETFALTFAHNQDDNFLWAEQIANAIDHIKKKTGADEVDVIAHSKGVQAARIYTSELRKDDVESTPYQEDVRRLVLVGGANKGVDYVFRHPSANHALLKASDDPLLNAPASWEKKGVTPFLVDYSDQGYSKDGPDFYPGQRQLLADLTDEHPLSMMEPDWYTTYRGGTGFQSYSKGIEHYIDEGGRLVERLNENPPHPDVEVAVLAGNRANIPGILNEYTGPSDGLVFVDSALFMPEGTNITRQDVLPLHHKALIADEQGQDWIVDSLEQAESRESDPEVLLQEAAKDWTLNSNFDEESQDISTLTPMI